MRQPEAHRPGSADGPTCGSRSARRWRIGAITGGPGQYERGNAQCATKSGYDPSHGGQHPPPRRSARGHSSPLGRAGAAACDPIFIVGLPRSGSTLLEQILASHSQVEGTQELADIQRIVLELRAATNCPTIRAIPRCLPR